MYTGATGPSYGGTTAATTPGSKGGEVEGGISCVNFYPAGWQLAQLIRFFGTPRAWREPMIVDCEECAHSALVLRTLTTGSARGGSVQHPAASEEERRPPR